MTETIDLKRSLAEDPAVAMLAPKSAPLFRRLCALCHELLFLAAFVLIAGFALTFGLRAPLVGPLRHAGQFFMFAVLGAYFIYQWRNGRRTLAMKTWGLRLTDAAGLAISTRQAVVRYLAAWIGPLLAAFAFGFINRWAIVLVVLNYAWAYVNPQRHFLHDHIAKTVLTRDTLT